MSIKNIVDFLDDFAEKPNPPQQSNDNAQPLEEALPDMEEIKKTSFEEGFAKAKLELQPVIDALQTQRNESIANFAKEIENLKNSYQEYAGKLFSEHDEMIEGLIEKTSITHALQTFKDDILPVIPKDCCLTIAYSSEQDENLAKELCDILAKNANDKNFVKLEKQEVPCALSISFAATKVEFASS